MPGFGASASASVAGLVVFGTFTSLAAKIVYELDGPGIDGQIKNFEKPWAMTTVMFVGMTFCLPLAYIADYRANKPATQQQSANDLDQPLLNGQASIPTPRSQGQRIKETLMLAIPTFFDLVATILMNIGLLSVTASVYQMLRGAEMLFAALFAVLFLKRSLNRYHLGGIACCILGITLVGLSSLLSGEGSASHDVDTNKILFGMALIVMSQAVQAAQITFEDFFMADLDVPPLKIVGFEGLFGAITMFCVLLPVVQKLPGVDGQGIHEDSKDTWHMIINNPLIARILLLDMAALLAYNVAGMMVTGHLGAVFRTVLETTRTLFVWLVDLVLFYTPLGIGKLGESWSSYSWLQAGGFVVLVAGTVIYGRGDEVEVAQEIAEGFFDAETAVMDGHTAESGEQQGIHTEGQVSSPLLIGGYRSSLTIPSSALPIERGVAAASSLKSSMNINAFGSLPRSVTRRAVGSFGAGRSALSPPPPE